MCSPSGSSAGSPGSDTVVDFGLEGADALDLSDLLVDVRSSGTSDGIGDLEEYLNVTSDGTDTVVRISSSGGFTDGVYDAGVVDQTTKVVDITHERLRRMFDINVIGAMLVAKEAVLRMQAGGNGGVIVNISSAAARLGSGNQYVDYAASKAAIDTFTKGLSDEVAEDNIRVMAIRPGLIETELHAKGGEPGRADRLAHMVPMRRKGSAAEVAQAILPKFPS